MQKAYSEDIHIFTYLINHANKRKDKGEDRGPGLERRDIQLDSVRFEHQQ